MGVYTPFLRHPWDNLISRVDESYCCWSCRHGYRRRENLCCSVQVLCQSHTAGMDEMTMKIEAYLLALRKDFIETAIEAGHNVGYGVGKKKKIEYSVVIPGGNGSVER